ncbi:MAG: magnesium/cobalt transporter CorA [Deltaproteobacteria bacterium]|nr:MAG: magnesium/cobalt transporter CorA [Deltaproteobacteria bacterium]
MGEPARQRIGLSPGTLLHIGERRLETARLDLIDYGPELFVQQTDCSADECLERCRQPGLHWVDLLGIHDVPLVEKLGRGFGLNSLALEDLLNTEHRPKVENFGDSLLVILKILSLDAAGSRLETEQVSIAVTGNAVLSIQEQPGDVFNGVRERLRSPKGRHRQRGADYLAYSLIDSIVDSYFPVLEQLGEILTDLEEELADRPQRATLQRIHTLKRDLMTVRKAVWPLREVVSSLEREGSELIEERTVPFLRDLYEHLVQIIDTTEIYRDSVSGLLDLYLSSVSQRTNEIMKVLTIMATIFIPLTFLVGVYGMNFDYMPELRWEWGYPALWLLMIACAAGMLAGFRFKKWL